jgi:hypothetical protein
MQTFLQSQATQSRYQTAATLHDARELTAPHLLLSHNRAPLKFVQIDAVTGPCTRRMALECSRSIDTLAGASMIVELCRLLDARVQSDESGT